MPPSRETLHYFHFPSAQRAALQRSLVDDLERFSQERGLRIIPLRATPPHAEQYVLSQHGANGSVPMASLFLSNGNEYYHNAATGRASGYMKIHLGATDELRAGLAALASEYEQRRTATLPAAATRPTR